MKTSELLQSGTVLMQSLNPSGSNSNTVQTRQLEHVQKQRNSINTANDEVGAQTQSKASSCFRASKMRSFDNMMKSSLVQDVRNGFICQLRGPGKRMNNSGEENGGDDDDVVGILKSDELKSNSIEITKYHTNIVENNHNDTSKSHILVSFERAQMILNESKVSQECSQKFRSSMRSLELLVSKEVQQRTLFGQQLKNSQDRSLKQKS